MIEKNTDKTTVMNERYEDGANVRDALDRTEGAKYEGALDVEYGQFAKQYEYISNLGKRFAHEFQLIVISLDIPEGETLQEGELEKCVLNMEESIRKTIRNVDVMTRYGIQQFLIILLGTDTEGAEVAVGRIFKDYDRINGDSVCKPSYFFA
jgi:hypothetical protein